MPTPPRRPLATELKSPRLRNVFGERLLDIPISATKAATGHLLGAAGGIESIFSVLAVSNQQLPPTINLEHCDDDMQDLTFVTATHQKHITKHVLCNGFGFGGVNAALIISTV